jgi:hypothetical protein
MLVEPDRWAALVLSASGKAGRSRCNPQPSSCAATACATECVDLPIKGGGTLAGERAARAPACVGHGEVILADMRALRPDRRDELRVIIQDQRHSSGSCQRRDFRGHRFDLRLVVAFRPDLQEIDAAGKELLRGAGETLPRHVAKIQNGVEARLRECFHRSDCRCLRRRVEVI